MMNKNQQTRRRFLGSSTALLATALIGFPAWSVNQKKIFLDYTEEELDAAYNQGYWASNIKEVYKRLGVKNAETLKAIGEPFRLQYGSLSHQGLDWYPAPVPNAPIHVHLHGGAWKIGTARDNAFMARVFHAAGIHLVVPDYIKVLETNGRLGPVVEDVCTALAWIYKNAEKHNGDPEEIYLSGHSAGGHLAGAALVADWDKYGVPDTIVNKALCVSGMYEMHPVSLSSRNEYVNFLEDDIERLSPIRHVDKVKAKQIIVAYGTNESPEFIRQSKEWFYALQKAGKNASELVAKDNNHFEILETFGDPNGLMAYASLKQAGVSINT
ncbi:alpha/beta hydrolase [Thalassotalea sp. PS06]|uniref:alpha/beta hydrolase n=1 Tax=Thalassotalea sp. PS06 TaxID=2594005 RepID=UPI001161C96B|nr:alpha/beta hydrolase [Thalassotalea sp. PS06]QDP00382.1 alpha/beta hydrolase [Thalassotalea sp. PS06]